MRLLRVTRFDGSGETFGVPGSYAPDPASDSLDGWLTVAGADGASFAISLEGVAWMSAYDEPPPAAERSAA